MSKVVSARRQNPLEHDIDAQGGRLRTKSITGKRKSRSYEQNEDGYVDARSSRKILAIAQDLADEDDVERKTTAKPVQQTHSFAYDSRFADFGSNDEEVRRDDRDYDDTEEWLPEEEIGEEDLDPDDMAIYSKFLPEDDEFANFAPSLARLSTNAQGTSDEAAESSAQQAQTTNLADLILQRIAEKEAMQAAPGFSQEPIFGGGDPDEAVEIPMRVVETFTKVGQLLSRYKSGPLPKPFKVLPTLPQWPELLNITRSENWTPHATYRATKIFISAPASKGQFFLENILLDRVRSEIQETKKLNVHLYNALKASFYRPSAFFKGFLFPLIQNACTLREAHVVSSVLAKIKIPVLHSAAALLRLCEISAEQTSSVNSEAAGAANIFIRVLLGKKYALPYKVVDALVFHFLRFRGSKEEDADAQQSDRLASKEAKLPVLWHQCLLVFAQTYRNEITEDQREALLDLLLARGHKDIGPEVRRELIAGRNRGIAAGPGVGGTSAEVMIVDSSAAEAPTIDERRDDGDDTMVL